MLSSHKFRSAFLICAAAASTASLSIAAEPTRIVFQNGRAVQISAVALQGDRLVIRSSADGFNEGQAFPLTSADHVFGEKPAATNSGIALLLMGKPAEAIKLLEPVLLEHQVTAKIPGNFWLEAARAALVAHALEGNSSKLAEIGKEISDATPMPGNDPYIALGKALSLPSSTKAEDLETAFRDLTTDNLPADLCAYASIYRANLLKSLKRDAEALEAYLSVPCLFPSGGMVLNAVAELNAAEFLAAMGRRDEAVALLKSAMREAVGTLVASEANKRLESLK
jgi:tetratricopeptide (TPR) repeat protein